MKEKPNEFENITAYSSAIYAGNEKIFLCAVGVEDKAGGTINVSGNIGKISGDIFKDSAIDKFVDKLWLELETTNLNGEENTINYN